MLFRFHFLVVERWIKRGPDYFYPITLAKRCQQTNKMHINVLRFTFNVNLDAGILIDFFSFLCFNDNLRYKTRRRIEILFFAYDDYN